MIFKIENPVWQRTSVPSMEIRDHGLLGSDSIGDIYPQLNKSLLFADYVTRFGQSDRVDRGPSKYRIH